MHKKTALACTLALALVILPLCLASSADSSDEDAPLPPICQAAKDNNMKDLKDAVQRRKEDIQTRDENGWTPLLHASAYGHLDALVYLLSKKADITARDYENRNALMLAAARGQPSTLRYLTKKYPAGIKEVDQYGWTPLHWAASWGKTETATLLIAAGADLFAQDNDGRTPLEEAKHVGMQEVAEVLRDMEKEQNKDL